MGPTSWEFEGDRLYDEAKACYEKSLKKKKSKLFFQTSGVCFWRICFWVRPTSNYI